MIVRRRRFGFDRRVRVSGHTVRLAASDPATPFPLDVPGSIYGQSVTIEACPGICAEGNRKCLLRHTASQGREMESTEKPEYFFYVTGIPSSRQAVSVRLFMNDAVRWELSLPETYRENKPGRS
ncbi:hypothetical protein T05_16469 [Trichinella murrelli]|uniref:Uncharacterized protein n=1 Tax=Trichinella murrelli TaxID=144512 RepID=A0A0V0TMH4_9BILA|nr:hypothetical protein T05_16469 [Trichinella murrelli]